MRGTVVAFDAHAGLGEIEAESGTRFPFHCTAIADRTRDIRIGVAVEFDAAPGTRGRWEATSIRSVESQQLH
jgi:cold shock CspA family protein